MSDRILDDAREVRDAVAREYGHDVKMLAAAPREQQEQCGRKAVRQPSRKVWSEKKAS